MCIRDRMDSVLKQKIANPTMELYNPHNRRSSPTSQLIAAIIELITTEDYSQQVQYTYMETLGIVIARHTCLRDWLHYMHRSVCMFDCACVYIAG